jgi:orotidine-5'-phosphate decarboxylase
VSDPIPFLSFQGEIRMNDKIKLEEKIIIALDVPSKTEALTLVETLKDAKLFKVGLELFTAEGPELLFEIRGHGKKVFLDLKLHDIPNTVAGAVRSGIKHRVYMMTVHASGGLEMMARAAEEASEKALQEGAEKPLLLGVTILTSLKDEQLGEIGMQADTEGQVIKLALLAQKAGMDGIVCSPLEIELIKKELGDDFLVVAPGIRPAWASAQDQKRIMTPSQAVQMGADYVVIGRPITKADSPQEAFQRIADELSSC